ncbi:hypothetical protein R3P38DRAFT_3179331 [Favolaschia claudopus]|uniref:RRM domain-containing protein n=1 Tax=Favolaschia claudopus TaxID=2862362 RepID=A0AAW0CW79_9AGAR
MRTPSRTISIGNVDFQATEDHIRSFFSQFGEIERVHFAKRDNGLHWAMAPNPNTPLTLPHSERPLRVQYARQIPNNPPNRSLFVGNIPYKAGVAEVREVFEPFGVVESIRVASAISTGEGEKTGMDKTSGEAEQRQGRGFAHVRYAELAGATSAYACANGANAKGESAMRLRIRGRTLRVNYSSAKPDSPFPAREERKMDDGYQNESVIFSLVQRLDMVLCQPLPLVKPVKPQDVDVVFLALFDLRRPAHGRRPFSATRVSAQLTWSRKLEHRSPIHYCSTEREDPVRGDADGLA